MVPVGVLTCVFVFPEVKALEKVIGLEVTRSHRLSLELSCDVVTV